MKFLTLLKNCSSIFKYAGILAQVGTGFRVAVKALETTIAEIYKNNPQFKYLQTLESLLSFVKTAQQALDAFTDIFGFTIKEAKDGDDLSAQLTAAENEIKKLL